MNEVFLGGLAYVLGEKRAVRELSDKRQGEVIELLAQNGLVHYRESTDSVGTLAASALATTLERWGGDPAQVDLIVYCSETFDSEDKKTINFAPLCRSSGLGDIPIVGIGLGGCANFTPGLRLARSLLLSEGLRNVAIVCADKCKSDARRIAEWDLAVLSDGAAACIVSTEPACAQYRLLGLGHTANPRMWDLDRGAQRPRILLMIATGVRRALKLALAEAKVEPTQIRQLVSTSTRMDAMRFFAQHCGLAPDAVFTGTLADIAHCYSSDIIINLLESELWRASETMDPPSPFLALSLGPSAWGVLVIEQLPGAGGSIGVVRKS